MKLTAFLLFLLSFQLVFGQSDSQVKMGENQYKLLQLTYGFYENPALLSVVEEVGHELEKQMNLGYKLKYTLLDLEEPNAFATPGGYVYVTRGLLALINTKDELAGILGHELSHIILNHGSKKTYENILPSILKLPGNIIGLITIPEVGNIINFPIEYTSEIALSGFSRDMESNADKLGLEIATKSGFYPYALGDVLLRLEDYAEFLVNHEMEKSIFNDHPMTPKRVEKLIEINEKNGLSRESTFPGTQIKEIDKLIYGQNPSGGIVKDSAFIHPSLELYCEFPPKWNVNNSPESISALSDDKNVLIVVAVDESNTIESALTKELKKYSSSKVIEKQKVKVNGLNGYQITLQISPRKQSDRLLKILWIDFPKSPNPIKVQAIAKLEDFEKELIDTSFSSIRSTTEKDFETFNYSVIVLKDSEYQITSEKKLLDILNNTTEKNGLPEDRFLKEIKSIPLSELK